MFSIDLQKLINNGKKIVKAKKDIQFGDEKTFQGFSAKLTDKFIKDILLPKAYHIPHNIFSRTNVPSGSGAPIIQTRFSKD